MTLTRTVHGIVCETCNKRFSGEVPAQQHLLSASHIHKVQQEKQQGSHHLYCTVCRLQCNSIQQLLTHRDSPRHQHMVRQNDIIRQQQALTNVQNGIDSGGEPDETVTSGVVGPRRLYSEESGEADEEGGLRRQLVPFYTDNMAGSPWAGGSRASPMNIARQEGGIFFENGRGHCYVCNIELTSPQHKAQHVEGRNHKKRAGQTGVPAGVMMCAICEVPLSGELNVQQHFSSERHRKRLAEQQGLQTSVTGVTVAPSVSVAPVPTGPVPYVQSSLALQGPLGLNSGAAFYGLYGNQPPGPSGAGRGWTPFDVPSSSTTGFAELSSISSISRYPAAEPVVPRPMQSAAPLNSNIRGLTATESTHSTREQLRFEWSSNGGWCGFCDHQVRSHDEAAEHLKSEEHRQKEDEANRESCEVCRVKFSGCASAKQHFNSESHKNQVFLSNRQVNITPKNNMPLAAVEVTATNTMTSSERSHYMSNVADFEDEFQKLGVSSLGGSQGHSYAADDSLTQLKSAFPASLPNNVASDGSEGFNQLNEDSRPTVPMTHFKFNILPSVYGGDAAAVRMEEVSQQPTVREYVFDGDRGFCHVCNVTFTSRAHAESHLAGSKHQKAKQRWSPSQGVSGVNPSAGNAFASVNPFYPGGADIISSVPKPNVAISTLPSTSAPPAPKGYRFDGDRGFCFACKIDLTSAQHANQHLAGRRHQAALERWMQEGEGSVYPLYCDTCHKPFTGQESAAQHYASEKHKKKAMLAAGAATGRKDAETGALIVMQDGQVWYVCEVCKCPLNTLDQMKIHLRSPRHNKEVEKAQKSEHSGLRGAESVSDLSSAPEMSYPGSVPSQGAGVTADFSTPATREASPAPEVNYDHLIIQPPMVTRTPGIFSPAQEVPACTQSSAASILRSGLLQVTSGGDYTRAILGTGPQGSDPSGGAHNSQAGGGNFQTFDGSGAALYSRTNSGNSHSTASNSHSNAGNIGSQSMAPGCALYFGPGSSSAASNRVGGWGGGAGGHGMNSSLGSLGGGVARGQDTSLTNSSANDIGTWRQGSRQDMEGLNVAKHNARGSKGGGGTSRSGMVIRPDGKYESDDEDDASAQRLAPTSSSSYVDRPPDDTGYQPCESDTMSTVDSGTQHFSSTASEHAQVSLASTSANNLDPYLSTDNAGPPPSYGSIPDINQRQPGKGVFPGFRYGCKLCQQPMNTKEDYEKHMNGLKHQMKAATVCAPDKSSESLVKSCMVTLEQAYNCLGKSIPRTYQVELMCKAMASDSTVVYLPTGTGKTLAAMMTLSYMLSLNPTRPVLFLVDKVLLVLQQARYIINELGSKVYLRPSLEGDGQGQTHMVKRQLKVAVLCGGLSVRDGTPLWKHDVIVTTAAFCQNLLQLGVIRWANLSLVVFDEAHHCTKNHPYNKLLTEHHLKLDVAHRPKVLGLTASPAGRRTKEETLTMLQKLLENLGGATIATVEGKNERAHLDKYSSSALLVPVCVPMTEAEVRFHKQLLAYFIQAYLQLMQCSNLPQMSDRALQDLCTSSSNGSRPDPKRIQNLAQHLMETPDQLSDMVQLAHTARIKQSSPTVRSNRFQMLQFHVMTVGMALLNSEDGIDFVLDELEREFDRNLNPNIKELNDDMKLPCTDIAAFVKSIADSARLRASEGSAEESDRVVSASSMSIFQELLCTLADPKYMSWSSDDAMALVLVRERKVAHKVREQLKKTSFVHDHRMDVAVVVGHGAGSGEGEGMNLRKQDKVLQGIKSHKYKIVVATSVAEEGVDLPECQLVVCLNPPTTVKAMVQMRGRARKKNSYFVVLCSSQKEKEKLEDLKKQEDNMKWAADHLMHQNTGATGGDL